MAGVCETEAYRDRLALNPASRERLLAMDPEDYIAVMARWRDRFTSGPMLSPCTMMLKMTTT